MTKTSYNIKMAKERLIPRKLVYGLGIIAALSLGGLEAQRFSTAPSNRHIRLWEGYAVIEGDTGFRVTAEDGTTYEFPGTYNGLNHQKNFLAVGAKQGDECAVAVIVPDKIIALYDDGITPYRVTSVTDKAISFYTLQYYYLTYKEYDRETQTTRITSSMMIPYPFYSEQGC